ncbi:MAG: sugar ABC transporter permease [Lachnospiraceae bacterium]|nr:sugar ABC transporter permease [Lachnospiraceae bacterium]
MKQANSETAVSACKNQKRGNKQTRKHNRIGLLFASPWLIGFVLFTIVPITMAFYYSFTNYDMFNKCEWVGLKNYADILKDPYIGISLINTAYIVIVGTPIGLIVALGLAMLLNQKNVCGLPFFRTIFYLPSLVPIVASAMLFIWVLNGNYGLLNQLLKLFGIQGPYWLNDPQYTKISLIMMDTWRCGGSMIIFIAALRSVPVSLYDSASLDGAGKFQQFIHITLPFISPTIQFNLLMGMINRFQYFTQAYVFSSLTDMSGSVGGGPGNSMLFYCLYLYRQAFLFYKMGYACAMAILLFIIIMAATFVTLRISNRAVNYEVE